MLYKNRCVKCLNRFYEKYKSNVCLNCEVDKTPGFPSMIETVSLVEMKNVSVNRIKELHKRVILPETEKGKEYVSGRMERGKMTDKTVDLRP